MAVKDPPLLHAPAIFNDTKEGEESELDETFSISEIYDLFDDDSYEIVCDANSGWDSDSDSYHGNQLPSGLRLMTEEEKANYYRQIEESEGFDIERLENVVYSDIVPIKPILLETIPSYAEVAKEALESHNQKTGDSLELIKVVKVNQKFYPACGCDYYFTLMLRDEDGIERIYRAKVNSRCPSAKEEMLFIKECGKSTLTFDSKTPEEKEMVSNDNSGASEGDGYVV